MVNGELFLFGITTIICYDFLMAILNRYLNKKRNHIDIEIIKDKLYINGNPVDNVDIHIEN